MDESEAVAKLGLAQDWSLKQGIIGLAKNARLRISPKTGRFYCGSVNDGYMSFVAEAGLRLEQGDVSYCAKFGLEDNQETINLKVFNALLLAELILRNQIVWGRTPEEEV